ncbi:glycerol-3-phosphate dehydrogenase 1 [Dietzia sp. NCCP-2495]|uniref:glycerol-3-phosphate dehydrogenase/oxidase n=1 Tax=Dietzia sp. NCCP-2495 TaxID=2934675 RepID=UPI00222F09A3|nr:glycerol-3-phosphate dehydrogenase/oxidase [Dietzia sp. NCCP-2495]GLB63023.1 glycerol-3-phosphate dehydrogenase 1 [Dietzia sp. NCCP-2495]
MTASPDTAPGPPSPDTALSAARRARELADLRTRGADAPVDLVVIGGGITGVGIALDAASRGLEVVLLEAHDLAFGTSRWSSKLAHGGLRYLATGNVGIARRSAVERGILLERTAPHLVRPLAQVVPVYRDTPPLGAVLPGLGFVAGTLLSRLAGTTADRLPGARLASARRVAGFVPGVRRDGLRFGHVNWDCALVDDARLVTAVARTAAGHGARIVTRARVTGATGTQVTIRDERDDDDTAGTREFTLSARAVIAATGVWAGETTPEVRVRPSRGTHLVIDAAALGNPTGALTVPVPGETNRFCFAIPTQFGRLHVGLTDVDAPGPVPDVPQSTEEEIEFLLEVMNRALETRLGREDVLGTFAGLRPLVDLTDAGSPGAAADSDRTADLSREHALITSDNGLITITGGKLTEYRLMAEQAVDIAVERSGLAGGPCRTAELPLVGAPGHPVAGPAGRARHAGPAAQEGHAGQASSAGRLPASLVERFGLESAAVVASSLLDRPLEPVADGLDVTRAEFSYAVTHEGAMTVDDVLDRRSRVGLVAADRAAAEPAAREAVALIGKR